MGDNGWTDTFFWLKISAYFTGNDVSYYVSLYFQCWFKKFLNANFRQLFNKCHNQTDWMQLPTKGFVLSRTTIIQRHCPSIVWQSCSMTFCLLQMTKMLPLQSWSSSSSPSSEWDCTQVNLSLPPLLRSTLPSSWCWPSENDIVMTSSPVKLMLTIDIYVIIIKDLYIMPIL